MRFLTLSRTVFSSVLALSLGIQPCLSAQMVRPVIKSGAGRAVPRIGMGALTSLGPTSLGAGSSIQTGPLLKGSIPSLSQTPTVLPQVKGAEAVPVVLPAGADTVSRTPLETIADALGQERAASRKLPGIADLGADVRTPSKEDSLSSQSDGAAKHFTEKAGFDEIRSYGSQTPAEGGISPANPKLALNASVGSAATPYPSYPSRSIRYNGKMFPSVAFRPDRPIEPLIVDAIDRTKKSLHISLYEFKNREILKALRRARARGVKVHVVLDYDHVYPRRRPDSKYWPHRSLEIQALINEGFDIRVLRGLWKYGIQHNKFAVFDKKFATFGSYNWTYTSERNHYENVVFTGEMKRVQGMLDYWEYLNKQSVSVEEAKTHQWTHEAQAPPTDTNPDVHYNGVNFPAYVFSPAGQGEEWAIKAIETAKKSVSLSMFTFNSPQVARALLAAKERKVKVRVIFDESQAANDFMKVYGEWLAFHNIPVKTLAGPNPDGPQWAEKDHNKFLVVDGNLVETGSMNWTKNGFLYNYEGMYFINNKSDASAFLAFFEDLFSSKMAKKVPAPAQEPTLPTDQEIIDSLEVEPDPPMPPPEWAEMPKSRDIAFNKEIFPSNAVRPQHPIKDLLVKAIDSSEKSIRLALYEFDLQVVLEALRRADERGVEIKLIVDYTHVFPNGLNSSGEERERSRQIQALIDEGFGLTVLRGRRSPGIMHHKFAVFDGKMVEFGSYNWSEKSEDNHFESIKFSNDKARVAYYQKLWDWMSQYSVTVEEAPEHKWAKNSPDNAPVDAEQVIDLNGEKFPRHAFSPAGEIEQNLIRAIRAAKTSIDIAMFTFYSAGVAEEILRARERNPKLVIRIVLDRMQSKLMKLDNWFAYYDFDVKVLAGPNPDGNVYYEKNHNKFMMVDGKFLALGSYNYTGNAETNNYENVNFFDDTTDLKFFREYFQMLYDTGWEPLKPKHPPADLPAPADFFRADDIRAASDDAGGLEDFHAGRFLDRETGYILNLPK